jgi:anti-sigma regulatory factor (Ser/Thr protein kinase)
MDRVAQAVKPVGVPADQVEKLKTAVSEATMNAMEHGNQYNPELPVEVTVRVSPLSLSVRITDYGGGEEMPATSEDPDIEAKLRGEQSPRGWGLFLIENMVDGMVVSTKDGKHTIDLILLLEGDEDADPNI